MNVIITGATGMVGGCALKYCLERQDVDHIISISRKSCGIKHEKLIEIIHEDFSDFTAASKHFKNQDVCASYSSGFITRTMAVCTLPKKEDSTVPMSMM